MVPDYEFPDFVPQLFCLYDVKLTLFHSINICSHSTLIGIVNSSDVLASFVKDQCCEFLLRYWKNNVC